MLDRQKIIIIHLKKTLKLDMSIDFSICTNKILVFFRLRNNISCSTKKNIWNLEGDIAI